MVERRSVLGAGGGLFGGVDDDGQDVVCGHGQSGGAGEDEWYRRRDEPEQGWVPSGRGGWYRDDEEWEDWGDWDSWVGWENDQGPEEEAGGGSGLGALVLVGMIVGIVSWLSGCRE